MYYSGGNQCYGNTSTTPEASKELIQNLTNRINELVQLPNMSPNEKMQRINSVINRIAHYSADNYIHRYVGLATNKNGDFINSPMAVAASVCMDVNGPVNSNTGVRNVYHLGVKTYNTSQNVTRSLKLNKKRLGAYTEGFTGQTLSTGTIAHLMFRTFTDPSNPEGQITLPANKWVNTNGISGQGFSHGNNVSNFGMVAEGGYSGNMY